MAGTITASVNTFKTMTEVKLRCAADAAAATFTATVLGSLPGMPDLRGLFLYSVKAYPGSPAPTDASDLTITDQDGIDLLGGRGVDLIDNTTMTSVCAGTPITDMPMPVTGPLTINITNNVVNAAVIHLKLLFVS
jgi:hypothetical protein